MPRLLIIFLVIGLIGCQSEHDRRLWTQVGVESATRYYIDLPSIIQSDSGTTLWVMKSFDLPLTDLSTQKIFASQANFVIYDCANTQQRVLTYIRYSEPFAEGHILVKREEKNAPWLRISEGTVEATQFKIACGF